MAGSGVASPEAEAVEVVWAVEEDREASSNIRDSASLSEMKVSEKMISYCGMLVRHNYSRLFGGLT